MVAPTPPNGLPKVELPAMPSAPQPLPASASKPSTPPVLVRGEARPSPLPGSTLPSALPPSPPAPPPGVASSQLAYPAAPGVPLPKPSDHPGPAPRGIAGSADPSFSSASPATPSGRPAAASIICPACSAPNPADYRFCVTCGATLKKPSNGQPLAIDPRSTETPGALAPLRHEPAPQPLPAPPKAAPTASREDKIVGAPVVDIASTGQVPQKFVVCARCHGNCVAGTKFCKYCGAPLDDPKEARRNSSPTESVRIEQLPPPPSAPPQGEEFELPQARQTERRVQGLTPAQVDPSRRPESAPGGSGDSAPKARGRGLSSVTPPMRTDLGRPELLRSLPRSPASNPGSRSDAPLAPSAGHLPREDFLEAAPPINEIHEPGKRPQISQLAGSPIPAMPVPGGSPRGSAPRRGERKSQGKLVVIVEDGSEGRSFSLDEGQLDIGRIDGDIILEDDHYVSPRHARLRLVDGRWILRDLDSTNRVYVRLRKSCPLKDADLLLLGLEVLQFQTVSDGERGLGHAMQHGTLLFGSPATPRRARLCQRTVEGVVRDVYHLFRDETVIGREMGDIVFTADPFLSRRHAVIRRSATTGEFSLIDLDSSNGTYIAIRGEVALSNGDFLRIGQHLFRVDLG